MIFLLGWAAGITTGIIGKEIAGWLPFFGRLLIRRSVRGLPEPTQTELRDKWLDVATKLPGDGLTKLLWGLACNWMGPRFGNPTRLLHTIFFYCLSEGHCSRLHQAAFCLAKTLKLRRLLFKMFADQGLAINDPNAPQPLLELAKKLATTEEERRQITELEEAHRKGKPPTNGPTPAG